jgi:hypothetical protein
MHQNKRGPAAWLDRDTALIIFLGLFAAGFIMGFGLSQIIVERQTKTVVTFDGHRLHCTNIYGLPNGEVVCVTAKGNEIGLRMGRG